MKSIYSVLERVKPPPISEILPDLQQTRRREKHGPCWRCGGDDRFIAFENGRGWCRQCGWRGDAIQLLRDRDGLSFVAACRDLSLLWTRSSRNERTRAHAHRFALATAKQLFADWRRQRLIELNATYRDLLEEKSVAEIAYRQMHRCPDLYSEEDRSFWTHRLASIYDRLAVLEEDLEVLITRDAEAERFAWWREEASHE